MEKKWTQAVSHLYRMLIERDGVTFDGDSWPPDQSDPKLSADNVRRVKVSTAEHETHLAVLLADDGELAERNGLGAMFCTDQFGKNDADQKGLDDGSQKSLSTLNL